MDVPMAAAGFFLIIIGAVRNIGWVVITGIVLCVIDLIGRISGLDWKNI